MSKDQDKRTIVVQKCESCDKTVDDNAPVVEDANVCSKCQKELMEAK